MRNLGGFGCQSPKPDSHSPDQFPMCVSHTLPGSQPICIQGTPGGKHQGGGRVTCLPPVFCTLPYLPVVLYSSTSFLLTHSLPMAFSWASSRTLIRMCILECALFHFSCAFFLAQVSLWLSTESPRKQKKSSQTSSLPKSPFQTSLTHKFGGSYVQHRNSEAHIQTISGAP